MFKHIFKTGFTRLAGASIIGALVLGIPAGSVLAAAPTPTPQGTPQAQPTANSKTPANLAQAYQKEQQALKTQGDNLTKVDTMVGKADVILTNLKEKGRDVDILQTILTQFKQDLAVATAFHNAANQILTTHAGFDSNGNVVDQAQAVMTVMSARDKLVEARLTLKGGISDLKDAVQLFRGKKSAGTATPTATPAPVQ